MNKVAAFALRRKNSILSMSEKMFCPPQPLRFWITPACAGKMRSDWIIRSIYWDHPRMCGEKLAAKAGSINGMGSPPRMRGKVCAAGECNLKAGITPACAGKRTRLSGLQGSQGDHPRVCGEKIEIRMSLYPLVGSPPRMRGKGSAWCFSTTIGRITPAYAGKRIPANSGKDFTWDHPRVCGEKAAVAFVLFDR